MKKLLVKILTVVSALTALCFGVEAYNMITGVLTFYDGNGAAVGPTIPIIVAVVATLLSAVGIVFWIRFAKEKKK